MFNKFVQQLVTSKKNLNPLNKCLLVKSNYTIKIHQQPFYSSNHLSKGTQLLPTKISLNHDEIFASSPNNWLCSQAFPGHKLASAAVLFAEVCFTADTYTNFVKLGKQNELLAKEIPNPTATGGRFSKIQTANGEMMPARVRL